MKTSDDQRIFAWTTEDSHNPLHESSARQTHSLLAHSPASFRSSGHLVQATAPVVPGYLEGIRTQTVFNNKGLHLSLPIIRMDQREVIAILNCSDHGKEKKEHTAIWLRDVSTNGGPYIRVERQMLDQIKLSDSITTAMYANISVIKGDGEGAERCKHCFAAGTLNPSMPSVEHDIPTPHPDVLTAGPTADYYGYSEGDMINHTTNSILLPRGPSAKVVSYNTKNYILAPEGPSEDVREKYNTTNFMGGRHGPSDEESYLEKEFMRDYYELSKNMMHYDTMAYMRTVDKPSENVAHYDTTTSIQAPQGLSDQDLWPTEKTTPTPIKPDSSLSLLKNRWWNRSARQSASGSIKGKGA
jgi:hypothetical protein